jgi:hypothetical protein
VDGETIHFPVRYLSSLRDNFPLVDTPPLPTLYSESWLPNPKDQRRSFSYL